MQHDLVIVPPRRPLSGSVPVPPDEDLAHLGLLVASLGDGPSQLRRVPEDGAHVSVLTDALRALGVRVDEEPEDGAVTVHGRGVCGFVDPSRPVECGRSATTLYRLASLLVGHPFRTTLTADADAPMTGVTEVAAALRRRAAQMEGRFSGSRAGELVAPFITGPLALDRTLSGVEADLGGSQRHVKEALLLSGLYADVATYLSEPIVSRDHLERLLVALGVPVSAAGPLVTLDPEGWTSKIEPFLWELPGDIAAAGLLAAAATLVPESRVCARGACLNPTRTGALDLLRLMGGDLEVEVHATRLGETEGTVCANYAPLRAVTMAGELLWRAADDAPVLVALAARAQGTTEIVGIDRLGEGSAWGANMPAAPAIVELLRAFGVTAEAPDPSRVIVVGRPEGALAAADVDATGDASRATTALLLALVSGGPSRIWGADALAMRFPRIVGMLRALGAEIGVEARD